MDHESFSISSDSSDKYVTPGLFVKEHIRFVMYNNALSFNCELGNYVGWEIYKHEIRSILSIVQKCGITEKFKRIQLRYISEFPNINILEQIEGKIIIGNPELALTCSEIKLNREEKGQKIFVFLTNNAKRKDFVSSLFDINIFANFAPTSSLTEIQSLLDKVHKTNKETFFSP